MKHKFDKFRKNWSQAVKHVINRTSLYRQTELKICFVSARAESDCVICSVKALQIVDVSAQLETDGPDKNQIC